MKKILLYGSMATLLVGMLIGCMWLTGTFNDVTYQYYEKNNIDTVVVVSADKRIVNGYNYWFITVRDSSNTDYYFDREKFDQTKTYKPGDLLVMRSYKSWRVGTVKGKYYDSYILNQDKYLQTIPNH